MYSSFLHSRVIDRVDLRFKNVAGWLFYSLRQFTGLVGCATYVSKHNGPFYWLASYPCFPKHCCYTKFFAACLFFHVWMRFPTQHTACVCMIVKRILVQIVPNAVVCRSGLSAINFECLFLKSENNITKHEQYLGNFCMTNDITFFIDFGMPGWNVFCLVYQPFVD